MRGNTMRGNIIYRYVNIDADINIDKNLFICIKYKYQMENMSYLKMVSSKERNCLTWQGRTMRVFYSTFLSKILT